MKDGQNRAIALRIEKLIAMPSSRQCAGLSLAISNYAGNDQIGVIEGSPERMRQRVSEFSALMDGTRRLRRNVAGDAARKTKLLKQPFHPFVVLRNVRKHFAIGALHISVSDQRRTAMSWTGNVDHIQVMIVDDPVQVNINKIETGS